MIKTGCKKGRNKKIKKNSVDYLFHRNLGWPDESLKLALSAFGVPNFRTLINLR